MAKGLKTGGRSKGTPNKITQQLREMVTEIISDELIQLKTYLTELDHKERAAILIKLLPYGLPTIQPDILNIQNIKLGLEKELEEETYL